MNIDLAVKLSSRAWCLPILTAMQSGTPGRKAQLITACGAPRNSFSQSLERLIELNILERTPGHGHPLRPEFRLTENGKRIALQVHDIWSKTTERQRNLLQKSWGLPLLLIAQTPCTNKALKEALAPITDRALSLSLRALEDVGLLERRIDVDTRPPRPIYEATLRHSHVLV